MVVATKAGEVVYERFYDRFTELDKAEIRAAFQQAADNVNLASDNQDFAGTFRCAVWMYTNMRHSILSRVSIVSRFCLYDAADPVQCTVCRPAKSLKEGRCATPC